VRVFFNSVANASWQETKIALGASSTRQMNGGWVDGDTLVYLRVDFSHNNAEGINTLHYDSCSDYIGTQGTSEASPHVAGIAALMLQKYRDLILRPWNQRTGQTLNIHNNPKGVSPCFRCTL